MMTKGEVLISGLDQIREGLDMISNLGDGDANTCPWCGATVIHTGGCVQCPDPACGWSACG